MTSTDIEISDNTAEHRFEALTADGVLAGLVAYELRAGDIYRLVHTEVKDDFEGQGVGSRLASGVLDMLRDRGARLVPDCPFIAAYMRRHPETQDLLADGVTLPSS